MTFKDLLLRFSKIVGQETTLRTMGFHPLTETHLQSTEGRLYLWGYCHNGNFTFNANSHPPRHFEQEGEYRVGSRDNEIIDRVNLIGRDGTRYNFQIRSDGYLSLGAVQNKDGDQGQDYKQYQINPKYPEYDSRENEDIFDAFKKEYNYLLGTMMGLKKIITVPHYEYDTQEPHQVFEQFALGLARVQVAMNSVYVTTLGKDTPDKPGGVWVRPLSALDLTRR